MKKFNFILCILLFLFYTPIALFSQCFHPVAIGAKHSLAVTKDGEVYAWGFSDYGQLGIGTTENSFEATAPYPVKVDNLTDIISVSSQSYFSLALDKKGDVYAWGKNDSGQLGIGNKENKNVPVKIDNLTGIKDIAAGVNHSLAVTKNGEVYAWGANKYGQLGIGTLEEKLFPVKINNLSDIISVSVGEFHSLALTKNGEVYAWGANNHGQLGLGDTTSRVIPVKINALTDIIAISAGWGHSMALNKKGEVFVWGENYFGELGSDGKDKLLPEKIAGLSDIVAISSGQFFFLAVNSAGETFAWGYDGYGELGIGVIDYETTYSPVKIDSLSNVAFISAGKDRSIAVTKTGELYTWGCNDGNILGTDKVNDQSTPVKIDNIPPVLAPICRNGRCIKKVSAGGEHVLALSKKGNIFAWGANSAGELGNGTNESSNIPVKIDNITGIKDISSGGWHSLILTDNGDVYAWGNNYDGELGIGDNKNRNIPTKISSISKIKKISAGFAHSVAISDTGEVYSWGRNNHGELGIGNVGMKNTPVKIGNLTNIVEISAGDSYTLALNNKGEVYSWGQNNYGQLGTGDTDDRFYPVKIDNLTDIIAISAGWGHSLALNSSGDVFVWGENIYGELGLGNYDNVKLPVKNPYLNNIVAISAGSLHSLALSSTGKVYSWGSNTFGELGYYSYSGDIPTAIANIPDIVQIDAGAHFSMAISSTNDVFGWGLNESGQLGIGNNTNQNTPIQNSKLFNACYLYDYSPINDNGSMTTKSLKKNIQTGWNLFGWCSGSGSPSEIFNNLNVKTVWQWLGNNWHIWSSNPNTMNLIKNYGLETISLINKGDGFWFDSPVTGQLNEENIGENSITPGNGWNLVTWCGNSITPSQLFNNTSVSTVWQWSGTSWNIWSPNSNLYNIITGYGLSTISTIEKGEGFWIKK